MQHASAVKARVDLAPQLFNLAISRQKSYNCASLNINICSKRDSYRIDNFRPISILSNFTNDE